MSRPADGVAPRERPGPHGPAAGAATARVLAGVLGLALAVSLAGCAVDDGAAASGEGERRTGPEELARGIISFARDEGEPVEGEFLAGLPVTVAVPDDPAAVVVLVPGGSWEVSDPTGFVELGADLATRGLAAVTITYGTADAGAYHPAAVHDIACGISFAAQQVPDVPVVVVGHSAGAHLAALVGLVPEWPADPGCPYPARAADAVVGLAGPYDTARFRPAGLLGPDAEPAGWTESDPHTYVAERPELPFLLVHGDADDNTPMWFTTAFAADLEAEGHPVTVETVAGADHIDVIRPPVVSAIIAGWVTDLVAGA